MFFWSLQFTDTLPKEMQRRRLALFTLIPDVLMFNPRRPKAVRNTIGDLLITVNPFSFCSFVLQPDFIFQCFYLWNMY